MDKYDKLFKGLAMCAGPECSTDCPYHGETRGGKTCRAWLLNDAAAALALETDRPSASTDIVEAVANAAKLIGKAEYWRDQAEALKEFLLFYFGDQPVEVREAVHLDLKAKMEAEADGHV